MKVVPLRDYVIVKRKTEEKMSAGGLIHIPDNAQEKSVEGEVLAIGPGVMSESGTFLATQVRVGARVLMQKNSFIEVKFDGEEYLLLREENILAILHDD